MLDEFEQRIVDCVDEYGWFALSVSPRTDSDDPKEWFTYTIGLQKTHGWPELICFGLASDIAHDVLSDAITECEAKGLLPEAGMELTETLQGRPARLMKNDDIPFDYLRSANWFAKHAGMSGAPDRLQLMWPDKDGHFPNDKDCDPEVRRLQTPVGDA